MPTNKQIGTTKNKLLRYKLILDYYHEVYSEDVPLTVLYSKYIYPKFAISRANLYKILATPVVKELNQIKAIQDQQTSLF